MQTFWYNSPVKFLRVKSQFEDVLNPQNIQVFGNVEPYTLELGVLHRFLVPQINNDIQDGLFSLFVVNGKIQTEIPCNVKLIDGKLKYITFKSDISIEGYLLLKRNNENEYYSNCVSFQNTEQLGGVKQLRLVTKHNYNRQKFDYSDKNAYFVTNIPSYEQGNYNLDSDLTNDRFGGNSTLKIQDTYLDEVVKYEFLLNGNGDIGNFLSSMFTNTDVFINGTQRTLKEKLDIDDFGIISSGTFTNVKDKFENNITINEDEVFDDLKLSVINLFPPNKSVLSSDFMASKNNLIEIEFNQNIILSTDDKKYIRVYRDDLEIISKNYTQLTVVGKNIVINNDVVLNDGKYRIEIDSGLILTSIGFLFNGYFGNDWSFEISNVGELAEIVWEDYTKEDKVGSENSAKVYLNGNYNPELDPVLYSFWQLNGNDVAIGNIEHVFNLVNGINLIRMKIELQSGFVGYSNVLIYNKKQNVNTVLHDVIRINNNQARFLWLNSGLDYLDGSTTYQMSTDNGANWTNLFVGSPGVIGENDITITSSLLTTINAGSVVNFRVVMSNGNVNNISNVVTKLWQGKSLLYIYPLTYQNGRVTYRLHVENAEFNGYVCERLIATNNASQGSAVTYPYGVGISSFLGVPVIDKVTLVNIPIGIYQCSMTVSGEKLDMSLPMEITYQLGYSLTPSIDEEDVIIIEVKDKKP